MRDRAAKWREADRRRGEARVLAWWRAVYGAWLPEKDLVAPDGKVSDPTTLPVNRFGPVGYARALALDTEEGRAAFERSYRTGRELPSCEQFAIANQILNAMGVALTTTDPRVWHAVKAAHRALALSDRVLCRVIALEAARTLVAYRCDHFPDREAWSSSENFRAAFVELYDDTEPKEALARLQNYSPRPLDVRTVLDAVWKVKRLVPEKDGSGERPPFSTLARIALAHGMFGARTSKRRGELTREHAVPRVARELEAAWRLRGLRG